MSPRPPPPVPNEPLTPDERAWAGRLARIGPHGEPPPALDARILAAAHAAVARRPQRRVARLRWPTLVGAAASLVIVVGMAWQLQPLLRSRPSLQEGPVAAAPLPRSERQLSADVLAPADPVSRRAVASPSPPEVPSVVATPRRKPVAPPPAAAPIAPAPAPPARPRRAFSDDAIPPYADYAGTAAARQAASQAATDDASASATTGERRGRAAAMAPQPFPAASAEADQQAAMPAAAPSTPAPVIAQERRDFAPPSDPPMAMSPAPEASAKAKAAAEHDGPMPDRIEVTGSRLRLAELPVRDDVRLEPALWLQRIRDRRDADDLDGARESLALLRQHHPRVRLPDDLARLGR